MAGVAKLMLQQVEQLSPGGMQRLQERTPKEKEIGDGAPQRTGRVAQDVESLPATPFAKREGLRQNLAPPKRLLDEYCWSDDTEDEEETTKVRQGRGKARPLTAVPDGSSDSDSEDSEHGDARETKRAKLAASTHLSTYEIKRLKNIKENAKFFAALNLLESVENLRKISKKQTQTYGLKREKPKAEEVNVVQRRSMRLQRVDPLGAPMPEQPTQWNPLSVDENPMKPAGPLEMKPTNQDPDEAVMQQFMKTWKETSRQQNTMCAMEPRRSLKRYKASLRDMKLQEERVAKVVKNRIFSLAIHPSESHTLVAAGDKWGQVGLWDLSHQSAADGVYVFEPHSRPVGCLNFSPAHPAHLLSVSYEGSLRCGDVNKAVFDELYRNEEASFSCFDFLSDDCSTLIIAHWDAEVAVVDRRTRGTSSELLAQVNSKTLRTVHVHPVNRNHFLAAGAGNVSIYDVRHLKPKGSRPVSCLTGHAKSVGSAYFSPVTGNRVVTISADDRIRVYNTSDLHSEDAPVLLSLKHNNNTGRWLTRFRPVWDPKQDDCFVVGSMQRPRQIEVFHESGEMVHAFVNTDYLGSVCSINAMHPTKNILVGGNSSGRLHIFMD